MGREAAREEDPVLRTRLFSFLQVSFEWPIQKPTGTYFLIGYVEKKEECKKRLAGVVKKRQKRLVCEPYLF